METLEPITIDALITLLRNADPKASVRFDFPPYQFPTTVDSWRGVYSEPALGHAGKDSHNQSSVNMTNRTDDYPTVAAVVAELEKAIDGRTYQGWKGGDYSFRGSQSLRVDNPGEMNHTSIVGNQIVILTAWDIAW